MLKGTLAAALTPLRAGGTMIDTDAIGPYVDYLSAGGVDGILVLGSTGEGVLLEAEERHLVVEAFREATAGRLDLAVHAGAMSTQQTVSLAAHALRVGADAVAVIAPPHYPFTPEELLEHFSLAAAACSPLPFYIYEFAARSGYAIPPDVIQRLQERAPNLAGIKISDKPLSAAKPYFLPGLDVFIGFEPMLPEALAAGAVGSISGLAAVFPEAVVELVRRPSAKGVRHVEELRALVDPILIRGKAELARRGLMLVDVRAPLLPAA